MIIAVKTIVITHDMRPGKHYMKNSKDVTEGIGETRIKHIITRELICCRLYIEIRTNIKDTKT